MSRYRLLLALSLASIAALALACGGDNGGTSPTATRTARATPKATATPIEKGTPVEQATATESGTPAGTPAGTANPPPPASEGTPAPTPTDRAAFLAQFQGRSPDELPCPYNPNTRIIECGASGRYAPNPPPTGQDINCFLLGLDGRSVGLRCEIAAPRDTIYYTIAT